MNETWYEINVWSADITPVTVVKKTAKTVTILRDCWGRKSQSRRVIGHDLYPDEQAAIAYLIDRYEHKIQGLKDDIHRAESKLGQLKSKQVTDRVLRSNA